MTDVATLDARVKVLRAGSFAESTKRTYSTYLTCYLRFCGKLDINPVPLSTSNLGRYIAYLSLKLKFNSITNYLTVIKHLHVEAGLENPVQCHYISSILRGTRRVLGQGVKSKLPITPRILADIFTMLDFSTSLDVVFWAVCLVAFFTFFRKSNLLAPSPACFDPERHLSRHHISFSEGGAVIQVNWSKTIQFSERVLRIPLPVIRNCVLCPSRALWLSLKLSDTSNQAVSAFRYRSATGVVDLTYSVFLARLRGCLGQLGVDVTSYSGHSFRRGGASFALECGVPSELIQAQGDWRSDVYLSYLDPSLGFRQRVAHTLGQAVGAMLSNS